jgi:hypothetical protein
MDTQRQLRIHQIKVFRLTVSPLSLASVGGDGLFAVYSQVIRHREEQDAMDVAARVGAYGRATPEVPVVGEGASQPTNLSAEASV